MTKIKNRIVAENVVKRKPGYLYYIDREGNVCEAEMSRGRKKRKNNSQVDA